jgi:YgiT-type zinc finger domain-containing protein
MICLICRQAEIVNGLTSVKFVRNEFRLVVNDVPARICPSCKEAYVGEDVTMQLLRNAEELFNAGVLEKVIEYNGKKLNDFYS